MMVVMVMVVMMVVVILGHGHRPFVDGLIRSRALVLRL
jgi:hypothetical protein